MITIEQITDNLIGKNVDDITEVFEDYNYKGETEVIISKNESQLLNGNYDYQVYVNHKDAPIISVQATKKGTIITADLI